jgi:hypothetical protein
MMQRVDRIRDLLSHLEGERAMRTPAEQLRAVRLVPGWSCGFAVGARPGTYVVDAGDGRGERVLPRERLIPFLQQVWVPAARKEIP